MIYTSYSRRPYTICGHQLSRSSCRSVLRSRLDRVTIDDMLEEVTPCDSQERSVLVVEFYNVSVFGGVYDLVFKFLLHHLRVVVYLMRLILVVLLLFCMNFGIVRWDHVIHPRVGGVRLRGVEKGSLQRWLHEKADVDMISTTLQRWECCIIGVEELHIFIL